MANSKSTVNPNAVLLDKELSTVGRQHGKVTDLVFEDSKGVRAALTEMGVRDFKENSHGLKVKSSTSLEKLSEVIALHDKATGRS